MKEFDVFLAHNSVDKPTIKFICQYLQKLGLNPWLDEEHIECGEMFQDVIQAIVQDIQCAAIFISENGLGKWQTLELKVLTYQCVDKGIRVIPVLLPGVERIPDNLIFLREFNEVRFQCEIEKDFGAFQKLYRGITKNPLEMDITSFYDLKSNATPPPKADDLSSEKDVDYTRLRYLLKVNNWYEANKETYRVMLQAVDKKDDGELASDDISKFPRTDLRTIDKLWVKYSKGHFGFSVQKQIYLDLEKYFEPFGNKVGWRKEGQWLEFLRSTYYDITANKGHLPIMLKPGNLWRFDGNHLDIGWTIDHEGIIASLASILEKYNI